MLLKMRHPFQKGFALIAAIILIVVAAAMAVVLATLVSSSTQSGALHIGSAQSLFAAEAGLERGLYERNRNAWDCATPATQTGTVGSGGSSAAYSVTCASYSASTTLSAAIGAADNVIPLASLTGFAPYGRVTVGGEYIDYTGTSASSCGSYTPPCLTGATRGAAGSTASAHASGQAVSQNLVLLTSVGTVGASGATRTVRAFAVGSGAIAFNTVSRNERDNDGDDSWNHVVAGNNRLLVVGIALRNGAGQQVTAVTYAGQPLLRAGAQNYLLSGVGQIRVEIWYRASPALGSNPVRVTLSAPTAWNAGAVSFTGVDPLDPIDNVANDAQCASNLTLVSSPSVVVPTLTPNAWVIDVLGVRRLFGGGGGLLFPAPAVGPGQVLRWSRGPTGTGGVALTIRGAGSTEGPQLVPGNVTMSWTGLPTLVTQPTAWALCGLPIKPASSMQAVNWHEVFP